MSRCGKVVRSHTQAQRLEMHGCQWITCRLPALVHLAHQASEMPMLAGWWVERYSLASHRGCNRSIA